MLDFLTTLVNDAIARLTADPQAMSLALAGIVVSAFAGFFYSLREVPGKIIGWLVLLATHEVMFRSTTDDYERVQEYIREKIISTRWSRNFIYHAESKWDRTREQTVSTAGLSAGYGTHLGWWGRIPIIVTRKREESDNTREFKETTTLRFLSRSKKVREEFAAAVQAHTLGGDLDNTIPIYISSKDSWTRAGRSPKRPLSTVFASDGKIDMLMEHISRFEESREYCHGRGLPWHTGIMLTGVPGTGKSSLIRAVASATDRQIRYLSLGAITTDAELTELVSDHDQWHNSILVIEDADAAGVQVSRDDKDETPVSLSTLLNVLDGLITPDGLVVIATTNHVDRLDPALIRPGRFDLVLELGPLGLAEAERMARLFDLGDEWDEHREALAARYEPLPGATVRSILLEKGVKGLLDA